jgi:hypothetical protein
MRKNTTSFLLLAGLVVLVLPNIIGREKIRKSSDGVVYTKIERDPATGTERRVGVRDRLKDRLEAQRRMDEEIETSGAMEEFQSGFKRIGRIT